MVNKDIKQKILQQKQDLLEKIDALNKDIHREAKPLDKDFSEQAIEMENDDVVSALYDEARRNLVQVNIVLDRIEHGTYGVCAKCEEPIDPKRLDILPLTTLCINCAEQQD